MKILEMPSKVAMPSKVNLDNTVADVKQICPIHGEYLAKLIENKLLGISFTSFCPKCEALQLEKENEREKREAFKKEEFERKELEEKIVRANIPPRFIKYEFEDFETNTPEAKKVVDCGRSYAERFHKNACNIYISGSLRTGKTMFAAILLKKLIQKGFHCEYYTMLDLFIEHRNSYALREEAVFHKRFRNMDLLVIDEFYTRVKKLSKDEEDTIKKIIDDRFLMEKPTVVITRETTSTIEKLIGARSFGQLCEKILCLHFNWEAKKQNKIHGNKTAYMASLET